MQTLAKVTLVKFLLIISSQSFADVDPLRGSYSYADSDFGIRRAYNSRSLHNGYFGFGWCSEIDQHLVFESSHLIVIDRCGLLTELRENPKKPGVYLDRRGHRLIRQMGTLSTYALYLEKMEIAVFSNRGALLRLQRNPAIRFDLRYDPDGRVNSLSINRLRKITVTLDLHGKKITSMSLVGQLNASKQFAYENEKLVGQIQMSKRKLFSYDSYLNLTKIESRDAVISVVYDTKFDRVSEHHKGPCQYKFGYSNWRTEKHVDCRNENNLKTYFLSYSDNGQLKSVDLMVTSRKLKLLKRKKIYVKYNDLGSFVGFINE